MWIDWKTETHRMIPGAARACRIPTHDQRAWARTASTVNRHAQSCGVLMHGAAAGTRECVHAFVHAPQAPRWSSRAAVALGHRCAGEHVLRRNGRGLSVLHCRTRGPASPVNSSGGLLQGTADHAAKARDYAEARAPAEPRGPPREGGGGSADSAYRCA